MFPDELVNDEPDTASTVKTSNQNNDHFHEQADDFYSRQNGMPE